MAVWYCNYGNGTSTGYYAVAQWAALTVYGAGAIVRQLATPAVGSERCFRTTAGGTSGAAEPSWTLTKAGSTTDATVTWVEVTGNSTYNWSAPHARLQTACKSGWPAAGDTVYVAGAHAETQSSAMTINSVGSTAAPLIVICVNASGSVPPVSADLQTSATCTTTGNSNLTINNSTFWQGITFNAGTGANATQLAIGGQVTQRFLNCGLAVPATASANIAIGATTTKNAVFLDNTTMSFGDATNFVAVQDSILQWRNTASALLGAAVPTTLFTTGGTGASGIIICDGVDLSAAGSGKTLVGASPPGQSYSFINCKLGASVTVSATPSAVQSGSVTLQISDSGATQYRQEKYSYLGTLTTETTFVRSGGASDGTTPISWKVVSTANAKQLNPFASFQVAIWNNTTGASKTATVEIENGGVTLTNAQVWLEVEYLGSSATPVSSVVSSAPADFLAAASNIPTSSVTWNGSLGSAVKQYLQVTFTPQMVGYVRATVYVGVASQTLYIDPVITIA